MAKTLYLLSHIGNGGTEKYVYDLISARGAQNCVLVYSEAGESLAKFKSLNVKLVQISMNHPFDLKAAMSLKKIIKQERVQVVHAQFLRENYIAILAKILGAKAKVIWTYHVNVDMGLHIRILNKFVTRLNHKIIAVSNFMKEQLIVKGVNPSKVQVIYNGVPERNTPEKDGIVNNPPEIAVVGRLSEEKGHAFLIEALNLLNKNYSELEWNCNIYGDGDCRSHLENQVKKNDLTSKVHFQGHTNDIDSVYRKADLVVLPSENDALPYVGIEALSYGIPLVGTVVGGIPEVIEKDVTGYLVEYGDKENMAKKIHQILTDGTAYQKMSKAAQLSFANKFTTSAMLENTFNLYK